jgi:acetoacetyl-CoA synthetase
VARRLRGKEGTATPFPSRTPDAEQRFFLGSEEVSNAYRPGRFDGAATYFLAEGSRRAVGRTLSAWRRRVRHLEVLEVPGHHGDLDDERIGMLSERHVTILAAHVSDTLA